MRIPSTDVPFPPPPYPPPHLSSINKTITDLNKEIKKLEEAELLGAEGDMDEEEDEEVLDKLYKDVVEAPLDLRPFPTSSP